ncbi:hypothetical protein LCGC14_2452000 [marine sediment metagenome]|uniref:Uncharacterized protein n=1 Tax=marine sediment metagenome TaxID=412755 RepID=A0A0F9BGA8_9ZZZZ
MNQTEQRVCPVCSKELSSGSRESYQVWSGGQWMPAHEDCARDPDVYTKKGGPRS